MSKATEPSGLPGPGVRVPGRIPTNEVIVAVGAVVCTAMILFALFYAQSVCCGGNPGPAYDIDVATQRVDGNWSLTIVRVRLSVTPENVTLAIRIRDGGVIQTVLDPVPLSALTVANWGTYGAVYERSGNATELAAGDRIMVRVDRYPRGCSWELTDDAHGSLSAGGLG